MFTFPVREDAEPSLDLFGTLTKAAVLQTGKEKGCDCHRLVSEHPQTCQPPAAGLTGTDWGTQWQF